MLSGKRRGRKMPVKLVLIWMVGYGKLFNATHVLIMFKSHNSIETSIYSAFSCSNNTTPHLKQHFSVHVFACDFIRISFLCFVPFFSHQTYIRKPVLTHWGSEVWKNQYRSVCNTADTAIVSIISKVIRRFGKAPSSPYSTANVRSSQDAII